LGLFSELLGTLYVGLAYGLSLKAPLGSNNVDRLGLFWIDWEFKLVDFNYIQSSKLMFSFSLSLLHVILIFSCFDYVSLD